MVPSTSSFVTCPSGYIKVSMHERGVMLQRYVRLLLVNFLC